MIAELECSEYETADPFFQGLEYDLLLPARAINYTSDLMIGLVVGILPLAIVGSILAKMNKRL